jgi:hypothetical protein
LKLANAKLQAEIGRLSGVVADFQARKASAAAKEKVVAEKMTHGLSREQAIAVIERQEKYDAARSGGNAATKESES